MVTFRGSGDHTQDVIELAAKRANELGSAKIVVASRTGDTALRFLKSWPGSRLVAVRYVYGFEEPNAQEMPAEAEERLRASGVRIVTAAHALGGVGRAIRRKFNTYQYDEIIASTLRVFGQAVKVACEITLMACDAGYVRTDERIIACAGSGRGADTALVLTPTNTHTFFDLKVHEIICKPEMTTQAH
jgi:hypothetical protein